MSSLDNFIASLDNNVILRDTTNNYPSIYVRHPKVNSSFFDSSLPDTPHPAFTCGQEVVDNAILLSKYHASTIVSNGTIYSLPNAIPLNNIKPESAKSRAAAAGNNATLMTIADHGFLVLFAQKYGYNASQHGNTYWGNDLSIVTAIWSPNLTHNAGIKYAYRGYKYKCLEAYKPTTASDRIPIDHPELWEPTGEKVGGTVVRSDAYKYDRTLTGSGPISWYFGSNKHLEADLIGNLIYPVLGAKLAAGEIQIIPNNLAADPTTDTTATSSLWRAIKPSLSDSSYELVTPGTEGTVHYAPSGSSGVKLVGRALESAEISVGTRRVNFSSITKDSETLPYVPTILYELGLAPLPVTQDKAVAGDLDLSFGNGPFIAMAGSHMNHADSAGIACIRFRNNFIDNDTRIGFRLRSRELA